MVKGKIKSPGVFLEQIKQVAGIMEQKIKGDVDFVIQDFLSFEESKLFIQNAYENNENLSEYYPIAECDSNKTLAVGISPTNRDQVFVEKINLFEDGKRYKLIANNIFEFVSMISLVELDDIGYGLSGYDQLYKNWGEDFWRVK